MGDAYRCPTCDAWMLTTNAVRTHHAQVHGDGLAGEEIPPVELASDD